MGRNRRDTLLKIGERLFSEHGYRDVSIKDITSTAGLGMGSFYTYFSSKEAFYRTSWTGSSRGASATSSGV